MTDVMKTFLCADHVPAAMREVQGVYYISWDYRDVRNNGCEKCGEWANAVVMQGELLKAVIQRFPKKLCAEHVKLFLAVMINSPLTLRAVDPGSLCEVGECQAPATYETYKSEPRDE